MTEPQDDDLVEDLDDRPPQDPDEPIIWADKDNDDYKPPVKYTEEAIIDGQKVTVYVEEINRGVEKVVYKKRRITLFGREFEVPLHAVITPMIVRRTGETCFSFDHGKEYIVISKHTGISGCYSIVDESGEDYVHSIERFEIVREGDGPPPKGFEPVSYPETDNNQEIK